MSAFKEKMLAEKRIEEIKKRQDSLRKELFDLCYELSQAYEDLAEAERAVMKDLEECVPSYELHDYNEPNG